MARGPAITQEEINKAHQLRDEGKSAREIMRIMKRSELTVYKMLAAKPQ